MIEQDYINYDPATWEIWKPIQGSAYEASNKGNIRSVGLFCRMRMGKEQRFRRERKCLSIKGESANGFKTIYIHDKPTHVHVAVAKAFLGKKPKGNYVVHHKDWNKQNNKPDNLEYLTKKQLTIKISELIRGNLFNGWKLPWNK